MKRTEETIARMKASSPHRKGWNHTEESRNKMRLARLAALADKPPKLKKEPKPRSGWKWTDQQRKNLSDAKKGLKLGEVVKAKLRGIRKNAWQALSPEEREKRLSNWQLRSLQTIRFGTNPRRPGGRCSKCGVLRQGLHRDHIVAKCNGGADTEDNIQLLCANCHEDKTRIDLKGRRGPNAGKTYGVDTRKKMSLAAVRRTRVAGKFV